MKKTFSDVDTAQLHTPAKTSLSSLEEALSIPLSPNLSPQQRPVEMINTHVRVFGQALIPVVADLANRNVYPQTDS
jgi:hypothetical protein